MEAKIIYKQIIQGKIQRKKFPTIDYGIVAKIEIRRIITVIGEF